jgi:hypothetical protein
MPDAVLRAPQPVQRGWLYSLLLHALGALVLLGLGRIVAVHPPPQKPVIPIDLVFAAPGAPAPRAAPRPARVDTTPHPARVSPDAVRPPADPLDAQLARLAQARAPDTGLPSDAGAGGGRGGGYTVRDLVRAQILQHWGPDARAAVSVALHVHIAPDGRLVSVTVVDQQRFASDAAFRDVAIALRNAVTLSSPFKLPRGLPASALDFTLDIAPQDMVR